MKKLIFVTLCYAFLSLLMLSTSAAEPGSQKNTRKTLSEATELIPIQAEYRPLKSLDAHTSGVYLNVLQDCWTQEYIDQSLELEMYTFPADLPVRFVWKHKIFEGCESYIATIVGRRCETGKPKVTPLAWVIRDIKFGVIAPGQEYLFSVAATIKPGEWDWFVLTECNDTNGTIPFAPDKDIDDVIGANLGTPPWGPRIYGPEPLEFLDPDPGGIPPGRRPGEEGATRCWCFKVGVPAPNNF